MEENQSTAAATVATNESSSAMVLRPYQISAISETRALMAKKNRIVINAPTGAGKTIIGCQIMRQAIEKQRRVLFLAHRRELIDQCASKLDVFDLRDHGVIMPNHPKGRNRDAPIQVASIQTLVNREFPPADLVIIDECHRAMARSYLRVIDHYPKSKVIGLTATPERLDGKGLADVFDGLVVVANIPQLISEGYLVSPTCYGAPLEGLNLRAIKQRNHDYRAEDLSEAMDTPQLVGEIIRNWTEKANGMRTIVFAAGVAHSQHIVQQFMEAGVLAAHLDGGTPLRERELILREWRAGVIRVVSNCQVLTEGYDDPALECCVLARATQSVSLYLQMVGRVMRPASGKSRTVILDHAGCFDAHDLPTVHREWTLEGEAKRAQRNSSRKCPDCGCRHSQNDLRWWLSSSQPHGTRWNPGDLARYQKSLRDDDGMVVCPEPECHGAECLVCANRFFVRASGSEECPHCGARYQSEKEKLAAEERGPVIPLETSDRLVERDGSHGVTNSRLIIKNEFNRMLNTARDKGYKRGWVYHQLCAKFGEQAVKSSIPRHRGDWWRNLA